MNTKNTLCIGCIFILCLPAILMANDTATVLAPVLDDQTFAVVHVNLTSKPLDPLIQVTLEQAGAAIAEIFGSELTEFRVHANQPQEALRQAGARDLYFVFSQRYVPGCLVAVPTNQDPGVLVRALKNMGHQIKTEVLAGSHDSTLVVAGSAPVLAHLKQQTPVTHKLLEEGLANCTENRAWQMILAPCDDQRQVITQMLPELHLPVGTIPLAQLMDNLQWAVMEIQTPPTMALRMVTQSTQDPDATHLLKSVTNVLDMVKHHAPIRQAIPPIDILCQYLTPNQKGRHLSLNVDPIGVDGILKEVFATSLAEVQKSVHKRTCRLNLQRVARVLMEYANDFEDKFPSHLNQILIYKKYVSEDMLRCPAVNAQGSYVYRAAGVDMSFPPLTILLYDKLKNHNGLGRHVMFNDTSVQWLTEDRFQEMIRQDNTYRREGGLPELAAQ